MPRALCLLRDPPHYRRACFVEGLQAAGYCVVPALPNPEPCDVVVSWNRYGIGHETASRFERAGARVVVAENGYFGNGWRGESWYALAEGHHAGAGVWPDLGPGRWDTFGIEPAPWRDGGETVILAQRGIGELGIASPLGWERALSQRIGARVRPHPGKTPTYTLEHDLRGAGAVVTWASSAALFALLAGIPAYYGMSRWIGAAAARHVNDIGLGPRLDDAARLAMFRKLAWAMWEINEIRSGEAFRALLQPNTELAACA